ncbi:hypothetical protein ACJIZ3_006617 [Penstemon smallii]|uniref:RING-CH-type domain-containing protein n=1 Tax=Penstemon smallii TaxID=265156 RepID=A0ABD3S8A8_9LAMI
MDPPPAPAPLQSNDDDPAVAAPEPHLPLINDDLTEPCPVPSPPPKQVIDIIEPERYLCIQTPSPPPPFNNNSCITDDVVWDYSFAAQTPDFDYDCSFGAALPPDFSTSYISYFISNPPPDQSSALQQQKKKRRHIFSRIGQKSSSNNDLDLKGHVVVKVRTTPADIIKLENNTRIIPEEEAVCRFCFHLLFPVNNDHHNNNNNNNVMMVKCKCKLSLTHELCASEWSGKEGNNNSNNKNKCDVCDQDVNYIPVTLSRPIDDSSSITPKPDKGSTLKYLWSCYSCRAE